MPDPVMLAVLEVNWGDALIPTALYSDGTWVCRDETLWLLLNSLFDPNEEGRGPEKGAFGQNVIGAVLERWPGSKMLYRRQPENVPGRCY